MVNHKKLKCQNDTLKIICLLLIVTSIALILYVILGNKKTNISNDIVRNKYNSLVSVLGNPTYLEKDGNNQMRTSLLGCHLLMLTTLVNLVVVT